jgi:Spy/CpxP family protein refolding chaperone
MTIDNKQLRQAEWYKKHVLTPEQREKLFKEKFERAVQYCKALKKQGKPLERAA